MLEADKKLKQQSQKYEPIAKLGDFGLSVVMNLHKLKQNEKGKIGYINPVYASPEILRERNYSCSSDIFAFGSILWELTRRRKVFDDVLFIFLSSFSLILKDIYLFEWNIFHLNFILLIINFII